MVTKDLLLALICLIAFGGEDGFNSSLSFGNINNFSHSLFDNYIDQKAPLIEALFNQTYNKIIDNKEVDLVNWSEMILSESMAINC